MSVTIIGTVVLASGKSPHEAAATVAVNAPPLAGIGMVPLILTFGFEDVTLYDGTPPATTNILAPPAVQLTDALGGSTDNCGTGGGVGVGGAVTVTSAVTV